MLLAGAALLFAASGCAPRVAAAGVPFTAEAVAPAPAMTFPATRVVPLRIVAPVHCHGCTDCVKSCRNTPPHEDVLESVNRANETFAAAGVRFAFTAVERIEAPTWWKHGIRDRKATWAEIRADAQRIFPWIPQNAYRDPNETKPTDIWLEVLAAVYGRPNELIVFAQEGRGGNRGDTHFPWEGRGIWVMDGIFGHGPGMGRHPTRDSLFLFGHELGHYFGLSHVFGHEGIDPIKQRPHTLADRWDLVYHPGSGPDDPHVFFNSREEAARYPDRELRLIEAIESRISNCREESDGALECTMPGKNGYSETHRSGSPALKGHSFPLGPEGGRYRWARNSLSYGDMEIPRRLSVSQIEIVRAYLQNEVTVGKKQLARWGRLPDDVDLIPSLRRMLGLESAPNG